MRVFSLQLAKDRKVEQKITVRNEENLILDLFSIKPPNALCVPMAYLSVSFDEIQLDLSNPLLAY